MKPYQKPRGTRDFLPKEMKIRRKVENILRKTVENYGFEEIYTPTFEKFDLIGKKAGDEIRKTMYVFKDKKNRELALRAEGTPSAARVYIDEFRKIPKPVKFYYFYPMFRYDRPQFGRYRELFQLGIELFGSNTTRSDIEVLCCVIDAYKNLGFEKFRVKIGDLGIYRDILKNFNEEKQNEIISKLDQDFEALKKDLNKSEEIWNKINNVYDLKGSDSLDKISKIVPDYDITKLREIVYILKKLNLEKYIEFDFSIARGIDYYTGLVFEVFIPKLDIAIGAGGRYDKLSETFGGPKSPAIGFGFGFDRIMIALEKIKSPIIEDEKSNLDVFVANVSEEIFIEKIVKELRDNGLNVEYNIMNKNLKKQLSFVSSLNIPYTIIVGENEIKNNKYKLKNMETKEEELLSFNETIKKIKDFKNK